MCKYVFLNKLISRFLCSALLHFIIEGLFVQPGYKCINYMHRYENIYVKIWNISWFYQFSDWYPLWSKFVGVVKFSLVFWSHSFCLDWTEHKLTIYYKSFGVFKSAGSFCFHEIIIFPLSGFFNCDSVKKIWYVWLQTLLKNDVSLYYDYFNIGLFKV